MPTYEDELSNPNSKITFVLPVGIEPTSAPPQGAVLSIERRERHLLNSYIRNRATPPPGRSRCGDVHPHRRGGGCSHKPHRRRPPQGGS